MFWERFYNLCLRNGKRPNPVGKEIGLSSGIISKWKNGGIPNGETLELVAMEYTDLELKKQIEENSAKLNNKGLTKLSEYAKDLVSSGNYQAEN